VAEHDSSSPTSGNVPGLIDQYRQRHRAWLAQADELVRLRDEVRLAAEREALEIVTAARRDVRRIIVEARRELLVLTAQLHAAVDAVDQSAVMPPFPSGPAAIGAAPEAVEAPLSNTQDLVRGARREVRAVLDEARAEIEALAAEAQPTFPPTTPEPGPSPWEAGAPPTFSGPFPAAPEPEPAVEPVAPVPAVAPETFESPAPETRRADAVAAVSTAAPASEPEPMLAVASMTTAFDAPVVEAPSPAEPSPAAMAALDTVSLQEPWVPESWLHELTGREAQVSKAPSLDLHVPEVVLSETASLDSVSVDLLAPDVTAAAAARAENLTTVTNAGTTDLDAAAAAFALSESEGAAAEAVPATPATPFAPASAGLPSLPDAASLWAEATGPLDTESKPALAPVRFEWRPTPKASPDSTGTAVAGGPGASATTTPADLPPTSGLFETHTEHSQHLSRVFASTAGTDSNAARVPARTFVGLFAGAGLVVLMGTLWWMNSRASALTETPVADASPAPAPEAVAPVADTAAPTADALRSLSLTIELRRPSWIRASIDGQDEAGRLYQAGETRQIVGAKTVAVRAGDAGAVFVSLNGAPAQSLGADGSATTRRFDVAELPGNVPAPAVAVSAPDAVPAGGAARPASKPVPAVEATAAQPVARTDARPASPANTPTAATRTGAEPALSGGRPDLVGAGQRWLDAYQRRDREAMSIAAADNINITDERSVAERFPAAVNSVRRDLDQVELELTGDTALLTARMTERGDTSAAAAPYISRISQIWVRRSGQWRLADVRIIGEARLSQIVR
jgi:hypothetical protein